MGRRCVGLRGDGDVDNDESLWHFGISRSESDEPSPLEGRCRADHENPRQAFADCQLAFFDRDGLSRTHDGLFRGATDFRTPTTSFFPSRRTFAGPRPAFSRRDGLFSAHDGVFSLHDGL